MSNAITITATDIGKPSIKNDKSDTTNGPGYIQRPRRTYIGKPNERSTFFVIIAWVVLIVTVFNFGLFLKNLGELDIPISTIVSQVLTSVAILIICIIAIKKKGNVNLLLKFALLLIFLMIVLFIGSIGHLILTVGQKK